MEDGSTTSMAANPPHTSPAFGLEIVVVWSTRYNSAMSNIISRMALRSLANQPRQPPELLPGQKQMEFVLAVLRVRD
jgi:hypothetical protein